VLHYTWTRRIQYFPSRALKLLISDRRPSSSVCALRDLLEAAQRKDQMVWRLYWGGDDPVPELQCLEIILTSDTWTTLPPPVEEAPVP
jgi:hypothetical protein